MLRERLLKDITDEMPMKEDFDAWSDYLRDAAEDMDDKGKGNEFTDKVPGAAQHFCSAPYEARGRGRGTYPGMNEESETNTLDKEAATVVPHPCMKQDIVAETAEECRPPHVSREIIAPTSRRVDKNGTRKWQRLKRPK